VELIYQQSNLDPTEAHRVAVAVWRTALKSFLEDDYLSQGERNYLTVLQRLLKVDEKAASDANWEIAYPRFKQAIREVLGRMVTEGPTTELNQRLNTLVKDFWLSESDQKAAPKSAGTEFLDGVLAGLGTNVRVTEREKATLEAIAKALEVPLDPEQSLRLTAHYIMWHFESGQPIEPLAVPINLHKKEICLLDFPITWADARSRDSGHFYVTSERIVLAGAAKNIAITYQTLLDVQIIDDTLVLKKSSGAGLTANFFRAETAEVALAVIRRALKERGTNGVSADVAQPTRIDPPSEIPLARTMNLADGPARP
jgi:hypothetical protein